MFNQQAKIILCASNTGLTAGTWLGRHLQNTQHFNKDEPGLAAFNVYLKSHTHTNIYLIANALDEDYHLEMLPHTSGKTRAELLERKLNQWSRHTDYKAAHFIERATDQRKDDRFLFIALNNTSFIQGWIDAINSAETPLVGIYMLSMISEMMSEMISGMIAQTIARKPKLLTSHVLLCETVNAGFRQSYLHNGQLQMSRMLPMKDITPNQLSAFYATETNKTRRYLQSQRLITAETTLNLVLLTTENHQEIAQLLDQALDQPSHTSCIFFDAYRLAKTLMANPDLIKLNPELLHMQLLANGNFPSNLAPPALTKTYQLNKFRHIIQLSSGIIAGFGLLMAGFFWYQTLSLNAQIKSVSVETAQQQYLYQQVSQTFPATSIATTELKSSVDLAKTLLDHTKTPERLMQVLSAALDQQPQIELMRLRWVLSNNSNINDDAADSGGGNESGAVRPVTKTLTTQELPISDPFTLLEIGFVNAKINDFTGDYHAANISVTHLMARLKSNPDVAQVLLLQAPINESSLANLQGNTNEQSTAERPPALFKLKLILKPLVFVTQ